MAPNGGPSLTSQARAAELNAAAAARARILNGELSDTRLRNSHPQYSSASHTIQVESGTVENLRRPNRPVDRYYPPVAPPPAVPLYVYQQPQYVDPGVVPAMYASTPYPVATEYYQPMYQPMQSYQQVYPSYVNGYQSPVPRRARVAATRPTASRPVATPTKTGPSEPVKPPATPSEKSQGGPSPTKELSAKPSRTQPSPSKLLKKVPQTEAPKFFTPADLSPSKVEVEIMRFRAEEEKIVPPSDDQQPTGNVEKGNIPEKSPAKSVNGHEEDNGHNKDKSPEKTDANGQLKPHIKHPAWASFTEKAGPTDVIQGSNLNDQSVMEAHSQGRRRRPTLDDSPLKQKAYRRSLLLSLSFLPPGLMPRSGVNDDTGADKQQHSLRIEKAHSTKFVESMHQKDDGSLHLAQTTDEDICEDTPKASPRRLQSPFQLRPRSPVNYYEPLVNKYPRNVFASRISRLEELWKVETGQAWLNFRNKPRVKNLPGPFKGFPQFPVIDENARRPMTTGFLMPPPGFAVSSPILLSRSAHWNPGPDPTNRATTYYDRVLEAEDWFHQSILKKKDGFTNKFQKKLTQVHSMLVNHPDKSNDRPPSSKDIRASQVTNLVKRIVENVTAYLDGQENEKRGFEFRDVELDDAIQQGKKSRRRRRRRRRICAGEYVKEDGIAPGSELVNKDVVGSEIFDSSDS